MVRLLRGRAVMGRLFGLVLLLGPSLEACLILLLMAPRRPGVTSRWLVVPAPMVLALSLGLLALVVLLVLPPSLVLPVALLLDAAALLLVPPPGSLSLVGPVAPLVGLARLSPRTLAELPATGLLLSVVAARGVLPVTVLVSFVGHLLVPVPIVARAVLLALALLPVM